MTYLIIIILGLTFGSFAGAVVTRLKTKRNFVSDRSECDSCGHTLKAQDLIPLVSWLMLRGRCRYCSQSISTFNPVIELVMTVLFTVSVWRWDFIMDYSWLLLSLWLIIVVCMVVIAAYDIKYFEIPMVVAYTMLGAGVMVYVVNSLSSSQSLLQNIWQLLLQLAAATSLIALPWAISRGKWMGSGDIYLAVLSGLIMSSVVASFAGVLIGFYLGTIVILPLMAVGRLHRRSKVPFGPFILTGIYIWFLWQEPLMRTVEQSLSL